ncbi:MAG: cysteine--tRNA ligase [Thermoleophilia bacterium]
MRLYSTLSRQLEELAPPPGPIRMYFCGPTVYQRIHIGNARPFVIAMWLRSWLRAQGYEATLAINVTDVNDKIYDAAREQGIPSAELAARATQWYFDDTSLLGLGRPDVEPLATETVPEIVALIEELIAGGLAYEAGGDVYFRVGRFPDYGCLSGQRPDQVEEQEPSALKDDPRDFALWKGRKEGEDTFWPSPWGEGRPGWHIECSAMAEKFLGREFEIHGGGLDLVFPHHENEVAQSRGAGRPFAKVWMHNGMLRFTGEKMSKSLGNVATLRDVVGEWGRETLLLYFLTGLWRNPIDFSTEAMEAARAQVASFRNAFVGKDVAPAAALPQELVDALADDFNTPIALAVMHEWRADGRLEALRAALELFGLGSLAEERAAPAAIVALAEARREARARRDFAEADRLRDEIAAAGWDVRDAPDGFTLVPAS